MAFDFQLSQYSTAAGTIDTLFETNWDKNNETQVLHSIIAAPPF